MRILHVTAPTRAGGLERVVEALTVGHREQGHEVAVIALILDEGSARPFVESFAGTGVEVHAPRVSPRAYLQERREVADVCRRFGPDVVHTHGYRTDVVDRGVATALGIPTVTTVHGRDRQGGWKGAVYEWIQVRNYRRFDAVVAVSSPLHAAVVASGVPSERVHCIPNAWGGLRAPLSRSEAREALGLPADEPVVGWVGRLIPVKGGDVFLDALSRLPEPRPIAAMIGYGPDLESLQEQARRQGIDRSVRFFPDVSEAGRLFAAFDAYALSSRSEGLPIVVLEAMAADVPIVATRVGGVPDVIDETSGWLVPSEDPAALASAIGEALSDPTAARDRASHATHRLETRFARDPWLQRYETVYRGLIG